MQKFSKFSFSIHFLFEDVNKCLLKNNKHLLIVSTPQIKVELLIVIKLLTVNIIYYSLTIPFNNAKNNSFILDTNPGSLIIY